MNTQAVFYASPLGEILLAAQDDCLIGAWFAGAKYYAAGLPADLCFQESPVLIQASAWLDSYFQGDCPPALPPLAPAGTDFQQKVWALLLGIPYGQTTTYQELARRLGKKMAAQAVGGAVGHNPISIFIPCHRVLGASGALTGYAGGLERKLFLLNLEQHTGRNSLPGTGCPTDLL